MSKRCAFWNAPAPRRVPGALLPIQSAENIDATRRQSPTQGKAAPKRPGTHRGPGSDRLHRKRTPISRTDTAGKFIGVADASGSTSGISSATAAATSAADITTSMSPLIDSLGASVCQGVPLLHLFAPRGPPLACACPHDGCGRVRRVPLDTLVRRPLPLLPQCPAGRRLHPGPKYRLCRHPGGIGPFRYAIAALPPPPRSSPASLRSHSALHGRTHRLRLSLVPREGPAPWPGRRRTSHFRLGATLTRSHPSPGQAAQGLFAAVLLPGRLAGRRVQGH